MQEGTTTQIIETEIDGLFEISTEQSKQDSESYIVFSTHDLYAHGIEYCFKQDNESFSYKGVLRGLDIQLPNSQAKLVRVMEGEIYDVVVDLRINSKTFGLWRGTYLSDENHKQILIPPGFAHGFYVTSQSAKVLMKVSEYWDKENEFCIPWDDADLNIIWPFSSKEKLIIKESGNSISFKQLVRQLRNKEYEGFANP